MERKNLNEMWTEVHTEAAARALIDPKKRRYLEPFMNKACSASQAAKALGVKLTAMLYQIARLQDLGLLRVVRQQARGGQPIKLYRAAASKFFVPFEVTRAESLTTLLTELETDFQRYFIQNLAWAGLELAENWGFTVYLDDEGSLVQDLVPRDRQGENALPLLLERSSPALWSSSSFLKLDFETAKALQQDIDKLLSAYRTRQGEGEQVYIVKLGLTPIETK